MNDIAPVSLEGPVDQEEAVNLVNDLGPLSFLLPPPTKHTYPNLASEEEDWEPVDDAVILTREGLANIDVLASDNSARPDHVILAYRAAMRTQRVSDGFDELKEAARLEGMFSLLSTLSPLGRLEEDFMIQLLQRLRGHSDDIHYDDSPLLDDAKASEFIRSIFRSIVTDFCELKEQGFLL
jgi:hypothetical protein